MARCGRRDSARQRCFELSDRADDVIKARRPRRLGDKPIIRGQLIEPHAGRRRGEKAPQPFDGGGNLAVAGGTITGALTLGASSLSLGGASLTVGSLSGTGGTLSGDATITARVIASQTSSANPLAGSTPPLLKA